MHLEYILAWICIIHLTLFAIILFIKKTNRKANIMLGIFMLIFAFMHLGHLFFIGHTIHRYHFINEIGCFTIFFLGPVYLQYTSYLTGTKIFWKKRITFHVLPFLPAAIYVVIFFFKNTEEIKTYYDNAYIKEPFEMLFFEALAAVQMGLYMLWSLKLVNSYNLRLTKYKYPLDLSLSWLKLLTIFLLILSFIIAPILIVLIKSGTTAVYIVMPAVTLVIYFFLFIKSMNFPSAELDKNIIRAEERKKIGRDMHDDLGSGLSKISFISSNLKGQLHLDKESMKQVEKISQASRDLVNNMGHLIWSVNSENDTLDSLLAYIREYTVGFLDDYNLKCHINFPETDGNIILLPEQRRNVFLVIKESLNNIVKHASAKQVWIDIRISIDSMKIIIKDDGKGFECESSHTGNGLKNMQYRMEQSKGNYQIESCIGNGTSTTLSLLFK